MAARPWRAGAQGGAVSAKRWPAGLAWQSFQVIVDVFASVTPQADPHGKEPPIVLLVKNFCMLSFQVYPKPQDKEI
ncbi:hypothetical protein E2C01_093879 [Portunus trituberculatus]|uniref:Uncharacterized protein n=1 Tax=Portunus trituberculatus TaxID=210409 RepID=A0A5B7JW17_PORTR|nr:hypothetical protein [Portunus trituberculatus]